MTRLRTQAGFCFFISVILCDVAAAQSVHDSVKPSLILLSAQAQSGGFESRTQATGFFVSGDGFALTDGALLSGLGKIDASTLRVTANADGLGDNLKAAVIDQDQTLGLVLLKIFTQGRMTTPLPLAASEAITPTMKIYSSGFSDQHKLFQQDGKLQLQPDEDDNTPWHSDLRFDNTLIGSPVYDENGSVIGIARGPDGTVAPVNFTDRLLTPPRVLEVRRSLTEVETYIHKHDLEQLTTRLAHLDEQVSFLQKQFTWSAKIEKSPNNKDLLKLSYAPLLPGGALPVSVDALITLSASSVDIPSTLPTLPAVTLARLSTDDTPGGQGAFVFPEDTIGNIDGIARGFHLPTVITLNIKIIPKLPDNSTISQGSADVERIVPK